MSFEPKHNIDEVLHSPFDFKVHNETFVNYCEVVIDRDGNISYGVPSHQEFLKRLYRERYGSDPDDDCPHGWYCDYTEWLAMSVQACLVWYDSHSMPFTKQQEMKLRQLAMHGCCKFG